MAIFLFTVGLTACQPVTEPHQGQQSVPGDTTGTNGPTADVSPSTDAGAVDGHDAHVDPPDIPPEPPPPPPGPGVCLFGGLPPFHPKADSGDDPEPGYAPSHGCTKNEDCYSGFCVETRSGKYEIVHHPGVQ